eukprot:scaffold24806_cov129-Isochrysis_galbana.AAC.5
MKTSRANENELVSSPHRPQGKSYCYCAEERLHEALAGLERILDVGVLLDRPHLVHRLHRPPLVLCAHTLEAKVVDARRSGAVVARDEQGKLGDVLELGELGGVLEQPRCVPVGELPRLHGHSVFRIRKVERLIVDERAQVARRSAVGPADDSDALDLNRRGEWDVDNQLRVLVIRVQPGVPLEALVVRLEDSPARASFRLVERRDSRRVNERE